MEFADCRERDDRTEWWNGAINRDGRVESKRLQAHTTPDDVESFLHLVAAMRVYDKFGACGHYFSLRNAIGRWQCRSPVTGIPQDHLLKTAVTLMHLSTPMKHSQRAQMTPNAWYFKCLSTAILRCLSSSDAAMFASHLSLDNQLAWFSFPRNNLYSELATSMNPFLLGV